MSHEVQNNGSDWARRLARLERLIPDLLTEMRRDLKGHPTRREFVLLRRGTVFWAMGNEFCYYYEDHPDLDGKVRILQNGRFVDNISRIVTPRYAISEELAEYLSTDPAGVTLDEALAAEPTETLVGAPEDRLLHFMQVHVGTSYADVKYSAAVHTPEFQDWRKGKLKPSSVISKRIENVLSGATPLRKKPHKKRTG